MLLKNLKKGNSNSVSLIESTRHTILRCSQNLREVFFGTILDQSGGKLSI